MRFQLFQQLTQFPETLTAEQLAEVRTELAVRPPSALVADLQAVVAAESVRRVADAEVEDADDDNYWESW